MIWHVVNRTLLGFGHGAREQTQYIGECSCMGTQGLIKKSLTFGAKREITSALLYTRQCTLARPWTNASLVQNR